MLSTLSSTQGLGDIYEADYVEKASKAAGLASGPDKDDKVRAEAKALFQVGLWGLPVGLQQLIVLNLLKAVFEALEKSFLLGN